MNPDSMLWIKAFHLVFMVTWFAGLFYLPRLFVYHAMSEDDASIHRFKIMERKLFFGIMTPGAVLTLVFGFALVGNAGWEFYLSTGWFQVKLMLVALLIAFHIHLGKLLFDFRADRNAHGHVYYRVINELPVLALIGIIALVVVKPF